MNLLLGLLSIIVSEFYPVNDHNTQVPYPRRRVAAGQSPA